MRGIGYGRRLAILFLKAALNFIYPIFKFNTILNSEGR
jgi:hypothetical protein